MRLTIKLLKQPSPTIFIERAVKPIKMANYYFSNHWNRQWSCWDGINRTVFQNTQKQYFQNTKSNQCFHSIFKNNFRECWTLDLIISRSNISATPHTLLTVSYSHRCIYIHEYSYPWLVAVLNFKNSRQRKLIEKQLPNKELYIKEPNVNYILQNIKKIFRRCLTSISPILSDFCAGFGEIEAK